MPNSHNTEQTTFLNVDLDVTSRSRLESLVEAFGSQVHVLYVGREGTRYAAHLELADASPASADFAIRALAVLVKRLPQAKRKLWDRAQYREFNIGIQAGLSPKSYELRLRPETLKRVASVGGRVGITVYAAQLPPGGTDRDPLSRSASPNNPLQRTTPKQSMRPRRLTIRR